MRLGRICIHDGDNDKIQAMVIALNSEFLVKKHFHEAPEIIQVLSGTLEINTFDLENKENKILLQKMIILFLEFQMTLFIQLKALKAGVYS